MRGEVAGEGCPGAILSVLEARQLDSIHLLHTPHLRENAEATGEEIQRRFPAYLVERHELPISDAKDYSTVMGLLARKVRELAARGGPTDDFVCVSSGTAEIRAAWFLLAAAGVLRATLLQVGSPAEPLFGPPNVREVDLDGGDWSSLRDLVMPQAYFDAASPAEADAEIEVMYSMPAAAPAATRYSRAARAASPAYPGLEEALKSLGIFIGSAVMRQAAEKAAIAAADSDLPVLITGETGTGKDLFAKLVHEISARRQRPFVAVNCGAIPKELVESHLFGHVKGAFTGAVTDQSGKFVQAHGGTLFLDELGELPLDAQAKLLRAVQDREVEAVGSGKTRKVDIRIVAATNRNLRQDIGAGRFREDLYYRLGVVEIALPPLRDRQTEIASLAVTLSEKINLRRQKPRQLSKEALRRLELYSWPGNIRELSSALERSILFSQADVLGPEDLILENPKPTLDALATLPDPAPGFCLEAFLAQVRKQLILRAVAKCGGNQSAAADLLGLTKQAISKFLKGNPTT